MDYGCCTNMLAPSPDDGVGVRYLGTMRRDGYNFVELPIAAFTALDEAAFEVVRKGAEESKLACKVCNAFFPGDLKIVGEAVDHAAVERFYKTAIRRVRSLGAKIAIVGAAAARMLPDGFPRDAALGQMADLLEKMADDASDVGVTIALEPISTAECNFINTVTEAAGLARKIDRANLKVIADIYHMLWEKEAPQVILDNKDMIVHIHLSMPDPSGRPGARVFPAQEKLEDLCAPYAAMFRRAEYMGDISIESQTGDFDAEAAPALAAMKSVFK